MPVPDVFRTPFQVERATLRMSAEQGAVGCTCKRFAPPPTSIHALYLSAAPLPSACLQTAPLDLDTPGFYPARKVVGSWGWVGFCAPGLSSAVWRAGC